MRKTLLTAAMMVMAFAPALHAAEVLVDRLAAEVNGTPIFYSEVMEKVKNGPLVSVSAYPSKEGDNQSDIALNDLINEALVKSKAKEFEIEVTEEELDAEIHKFLEGRGLDMNGLKAALKQQGMSYDKYRADFRVSLLLQLFLGRVIAPSVKVTDKDVEQYYLRTYRSAAQGVRVTLRQLFVAVDPTASEAIQKAKEELSQKIASDLKGGMPFDQAVKIYSDDKSSRDTGGLLPELELKDLSEFVKTHVESLAEKEFAGPIKNDMGYYFFYLEKKALSGSNDYMKVRQELEGKLKREETDKQMMRWLEDQRRRSKIRVITDAVAK